MIRPWNPNIVINPWLSVCIGAPWKLFSTHKCSVSSFQTEEIKEPNPHRFETWMQKIDNRPRDLEGYVSTCIHRYDPVLETGIHWCHPISQDQPNAQNLQCAWSTREVSAFLHGKTLGKGPEKPMLWNLQRDDISVTALTGNTRIVEWKQTMIFLIMSNVVRSDIAEVSPEHIKWSFMKNIDITSPWHWGAGQQNCCTTCVFFGVNIDIGDSRRTLHKFLVKHRHWRSAILGDRHWTYRYDSIWWFPEGRAIPSYHEFLLGIFPTKNHPSIGISPWHHLEVPMIQSSPARPRGKMCCKKAKRLGF